MLQGQAIKGLFGCVVRKAASEGELCQTESLFDRCIAVVGYPHLHVALQSTGGSSP